MPFSRVKKEEPAENTSIKPEPDSDTNPSLDVEDKAVLTSPNENEASLIGKLEEPSLSGWLQPVAIVKSEDPDDQDGKTKQEPKPKRILVVVGYI
jgi:hypothetical protein